MQQHSIQAASILPLPNDAILIETSAGSEQFTDCTNTAWTAVVDEQGALLAITGPGLSTNHAGREEARIRARCYAAMPQAVEALMACRALLTDGDATPDDAQAALDKVTATLFAMGITNAAVEDACV